MANIEIGGRLHSTATGNVVTGANEVLDDNQNRKQQEINAELIEAVGTGGSVDSRIAAAKAEIIGDASTNYNTLGKIEDKVEDIEDNVAFIDTTESSSAVVPEFDPESQTVHITAQTLSEQQKAQVRTNIDVYSKGETYSAVQLNNMITTPNQQYVSVTANSQTTSVTDVLPATGEANTVYRVGNWDGSQFDASVYSEYAWNGTQYIFLCVKSQIGEVFDISVYNNNAKYTDLADALGTNGEHVPQSLQKGGMSVKFVRTYDNKYVQYRLMSDTWSIDTDEWALSSEGVLVDNPEFIFVKTDSEDKILWAIRKNGDFYFGAGCPQQVIDFVNSIKNELLVAILTKVDKENGKSLIDAEFADSVSYVENPEFKKVWVDIDEKIILAFKSNGDVLFGCGVPSQIIKYIDSLGIDTIKEDINKINNKIYENGIPDYWMTYLNSKESDIEDALENAGNHGDLFIFFSDYHLVKNTLQTPNLIKKLYDKYGKIKVISGGDILNTHATKEASMKLLEDFIESFSDVELYNVFGNHDDNPYGSSTDSHLSINDYYPLLFKTLESNPNVSLNTNGYYYIDNRVQKIRYVILNTFGNGIGTSEPKHLEELDWFVSVLNSVEQGWYVVVVTHMFYEIHLNPSTGLHFVDKTYGLLIQAITDAYQTKQAGQYNGYTFDFQNASGNMACIITGHLHYDYSEELSTGYPVIGIIQDGILYPSAMEDNPSRETGTYTEQAFDLVSINTEDRVIKTIRFGVGDNRNFSF